MTASPADSLAIAQTVGVIWDALFKDMDPVSRAFLLGVIVSVLYKGWKWVVDPATPPFAMLSAQWEKYRGVLNVVVPALIGWAVNGHKLDFIGVLSALAPFFGYGMMKAGQSLVTGLSTTTAAGIKKSAAAVILLGVLLVPVTTQAATMAPAKTSLLTSITHPAVPFLSFSRVSAGAFVGYRSPDFSLQAFDYVGYGQVGYSLFDHVVLRVRADRKLNRGFTGPCGVEGAIGFVF